MTELLAYAPETEYVSVEDDLEYVFPHVGVGEKSASGTAFYIDKPSGLTYKLYSAKFYISKYGNPTGTIKAHLYVGKVASNPAYHIPDGNSVAESEAINIEDLTTSLTLTEFIFYLEEQYVMTSQTWYVIVIQVESGSTVDTNNYVKVGLDTMSVDHVFNETSYYTNATNPWGWNSARDGIFYVYGYFYCDCNGKFNETKICLIDAVKSAVDEATVEGNWRQNIASIVRSLPFVTVRMKDVLSDVYDRNIGETSDGSIAHYPFSLFIFHSNCMESGEEKGKYAQDVADRIISYLANQPSVVGFDIEALTARESEAEGGYHRISRVIIEGQINIKRID